MGKREFVHKIWFTILVPLSHPLPEQRSDGLPVEYLLKDPQTELRTLGPKLRTNSPKIASKQNDEQKMCVSQKTREGCGCLWDAFGGSRGKLREGPGKIVENIFPNREMLYI